jgi:hypothetical protein
MYIAIRLELHDTKKKQVEIRDGNMALQAMLRIFT